MIEWLIDRANTKNPDFDGTGKERGWEAALLRYWPASLTADWWRWLFDGLGKMPWLNLWGPPWLDWYELRGWLRTGRWRAPYLLEETRFERFWCRLRGHPKGTYLWGWDEPHYSCSGCGEELG